MRARKTAGKNLPRRKKVPRVNQPLRPIVHPNLKAMPQNRNLPRNKRSLNQGLTVILFTALISCAAYAQSRYSQRGGDSEGVILSVTAWRTDRKADPIKPENVFLYENGIEQKVKNFSYDPSPAKIVLLVDNSKTVPIDIEKMK